MLCKKCNREIPDNSVFCMYCGGKTTRDPRQSRSGNGMGTATKRGNTWTARVTIGWKVAPDGHKVQVRRTKGGFKTRKAAIEYMEMLRKSALKGPMTLSEIFAVWSDQYSHRISASTMAGYRSAYNHFKPLHPLKVDKITANMLQGCINRCTKGKRTKQLMKVIAGLLMKYAIDDDQILKNPAANLYTGNDPTKHQEPITEDELEKIRDAFEREEYAKYVYAMCFLGFRPTEFFSLTKDSLHQVGDIRYLCAGIKTEAGKDRPVTIPSKISWIIDEQLALEGTQYLFPRKTPDGKYVHMDVQYFRRWIFKPMMERLGISGKVPYSARHTFADKIKKAAGADRDKAALIGHTDYALTKRVYQSTNIAERDEITRQL